MATRRSATSLVAAMVFIVVSTFFALTAASAGAQTECGAPGYNAGAALATNPTTVTVGNTTTVSGSGFAPNCPVTVTITGANGVVATIQVTTDTTGSFTATVNTSGYATGTYTATAVQGALSVSTTFTVVAASVTPVTTTLPVTGSSNTGMLVQAGLVLVALGGLIVLVTRKRGASASVSS